MGEPAFASYGAAAFASAKTGRAHDNGRGIFQASWPGKPPKFGDVAEKLKQFIAIV